MEFKEFFCELGALLYLIVLNVYYWLEALYYNIFPSYKSVKNEIVLITGAAGGIGSALVKQFYELGATIVCVDSNEKELNILKDQYQSTDKKNDNNRIFFYKLDITSTEQVKSVAESIRKEVGFVNILINNAGIVNQGKLLLDLTEGEINRLFQVNTLSQFWLVREFLPKMIENNHGHIVNVSSVCGLQGGYKLTDYCASKFAVVGFTESLRVELKVMNPKNKIQVTLVCPFHVRTKLFDGVEFSKFKWIRLSFTPNEVAESIVNGVLTNKCMVFIPKTLCHVYLGLKGLTTTKLSDFAQTVFDFNGGMDKFKGKI